MHKLLDLLHEAIAKKLPQKSFILLSALCTPVSGDEIIRIFQSPLNDEQIRLFVDWATSSINNCRQFWTNLGKVEDGVQVRYLQEVRREYRHQDFVYNEFTRYASEYLKSRTPSSEVVNELVHLLGVAEDSSSGEFIELFKLVKQTGYNLQLRTRGVLTTDQLNRLADLKLIETEHTEDTLEAAVSLDVTTKLDTYLEVKRKLWIYQITRDFSKLQLYKDTGSFLRHFKALVANQDNHKVAQAMVSSFPFDVVGFHLFNVRYFISTVVLPILKDLGASVEELDVTNEIEQLLIPRTPPDLKKLKDLLNSDPEFVSLEESGIIQFISDLSKAGSQDVVCETILDCMREFIGTRQLEKLNRLLLALLSNIDMVNIILFHTDLSILYILIDYVDFEAFTMGPDEDFQDVYSYCGVAVLNIFLILEVFQIDLSKIELNSYTVSLVNNFYYRLGDNLTNNTPMEKDNDDLTIIGNYNTLVTEWINALFDDSNDGLSDELMKSLSIKQIYKLMAIIYKQAIMATKLGKISMAILSNGLDYLSQPFLLPVAVCLIKWMARDDKNSPLYKQVISDLIKSNIGADANPTSRAMLNICGNDVSSVVGDARIKQYIHYKDETTSTANVWEKVNFTSKFNQFDILLKNKRETMIYLIQEVYAFQETKDENIKLFINLLVSISILDSIQNGDDVVYWKQELNKTSSQDVGNSSSSSSSSSSSTDDVFSCTLDYHYSSIFNDDVDKVTEDVEDFTNTKGDDEQGDIEMKVPTSDEVKSAQHQLILQDSLLAHFKAIKDKTTHNNLFYNTVRLLTDKILEELDTWS
ncbi:NUT1 [Candida theae]|uniref:Mediator of RNA polymerase II transcription subunit 5 n=1 Tax=Candida theae TaxID=1198502 RepID=A0AAD5FYZ3_9ASCO|nr:NUT1 [Candida theae]KAI5958869.1 NUT1 [Candida theae]